MNATGKAAGATPDIVDELLPFLPARVQKATVDASGRLAFELYVHLKDVEGGGAKRWLCVDGAAVRLDEARPVREGEEALTLQGLVRKELVPSALTAAAHEGPVLRLTFSRPDTRDRFVLVERTADPRAIVAMDSDEGVRILGVLMSPRAARQSSDGRDLRRGRLWTPPSASAAAPSTEKRPTGVPAVDAALLALRAQVRAERKRKKRLVEALEGDLTKHGDAAVHEQNGELLKTALGRIARGAVDVVVQDWEGNARTLALDPTLDAKANLERFFKRAKKAREAGLRVAPRLDDARADLAAVDDVARAIAGNAPAAADLERAHTLLARPEAGASARRRAALAGKRQPWRSFTCAGDVVVRVGRGAKDNDALVKSARGNDVWLHARGFTGAHVVIPSSGAEIDPELMLDAAHLAAHFSAARAEARVDVQHTRIKNVKKPGPGAPAGMVHIAHESVLHLRVDEARTKRLLSREVPG